MAKTKTVPLSLLDKAISAVSPSAGLRRYQAKRAMAMLGGSDSYHGSDQRRRSIRNWMARSTSADAATLPALNVLRANSRDLVRNSPLAGGAINGVTTAVVGTGLSVQPEIASDFLRLTSEQADAWQKSAKQLFEMWAARAEWCDITAALNFYGLQELAFRSALESGDVFALLPMRRDAGVPFATRVQLIEADRVCNPSGIVDGVDDWAGGIKVDGYGRPVAAAIAEKHPGGYVVGGNSWEQVPFFGEKTGRRNLLHMMTVLRPGQRRGVPYLSPVIEPIKQLGTYTDAEIMAAVVSATFTVFVRKPEIDTPPPPVGGGYQQPVSAGSSSGNDVGLDLGGIVDLAPGEDVSFADPNRPNAAFDPFFQAMVRQIGMALELPFEVLIKHYTASYSAARAALLEAWRFFRKRREWLAAQFCQPIYEAIITEAIIDGRLRAPGFLRDPLVRAAYLRAVWIGDAPGAIDPLKEAEAAGKRIEIGISDKSAETIAYSGRNWEDVNAQRARELNAERASGTLAQLPAPTQPEQGASIGNPDQADTEGKETK